MAIDRLPSGNWRVRWRIPDEFKLDDDGNIRRDKQGRPVHETDSRTFPNRDQAKRFDDEIKGLIATEKPLPRRTDPDKAMTVAGLVKAWRAHKVAKGDWKTVKTAGEHEILQRRHIDPYIGGLIASSVSPQQILGLPPRLQADDRPAGVIRNVMDDLRNAFSYAVVLGVRQDNPATEVNAVKPSRDRESRVVPLTPVQVEAIRQAILDADGKWSQRDATFLSVLAYIGCRPAEARGLKWSDWSDDDGRLSIIRQIDSKDREAPTKRAPSSDRRVILWAPVIEDLTAWRKLSGRDGDDYMFPGASADFMTLTDYGNWREDIWQKYGPGGRLYVLRHTHASLRVRSGEDRQRIAHHMGHQVRTLDIKYTHHFTDYETDPKPIIPEDLIWRARGIEPPTSDDPDLSSLADDEREAVLALRAKKIKNTIEAAWDHDAETEAAWDEAVG